jgi:MscS family membrane protein
VEFLGVPIETWQQIGIALAIVLSAGVLARLVLLFLDQGVARLSRRTRTHFDDVILGAVRMPLFWLIVIIALQIALRRLSFLPDAWKDAYEHLFFALYLVIGYVFVHRLANNTSDWYAREVASQTESRVDEQVLPFARRVVNLSLVLIAAIMLLSHFDVDVSAFVTTLGIGSLAIALAAQATLADTISGFVIMTDRPFRIGDRIEILELGTWGDVLDIGLRSTRIRTRDNRMVVVPNSVIGKSLVVNHSVPSSKYRVETRVGVAYGTDIEYAKYVMIEAVRSQDWVMQDERIEALFIEYGESALVFRVRCWIEDYVEARRVIDKLNSCLYEALTEANIEMPFPSRVLYYRGQKALRNVGVPPEGRCQATGKTDPGS